MRHRLGVAGLIALGAAAAGCHGGDEDLVGIAQLSVTAVPAQVFCISIEAAGSGRDVQRAFDVFPGQPAVLRFDGTPTGLVTFTARAFPSACDLVGGSSPTWASDPTAAEVDPGVLTRVHLQLHQAGDVDIDIDFDDGGTDGGVPDMGDMSHGPDGGNCTGAVPTNREELVAASATVPLDRNQFSLDLNGDGRPDNQFGNITGALAQQGLDSQTTLTDSIVHGNNVFLVDVRSNDPLFWNDPCALLALLSGVPTATPPRFDGSDVFVWDQQAPAFLSGAFFNGQLATTDVAPTVTPARVTIKLPIFTALVSVPLVGVHLSLQHNPPGQNIVGQLNGAIRNSDVQGVVVPGIAQALQNQVDTRPMDQTTLTMLQLFDTGGTPSPACNLEACQNPDGTCAAKGDRKISICEIATSSLIQNVLAPDVQLFSDDGMVYQPNPMNTHKDSLSVGIGLGFSPAGISNF